MKKDEIEKILLEENNAKVCDTIQEIIIKDRERVSKLLTELEKQFKK
tara:strand:+ start:628 stop:768 length:141 start_codon:yes stop_codon:yes gene_type:complete